MSDIVTLARDLATVAYAWSIEARAAACGVSPAQAEYARGMADAYGRIAHVCWDTIEAAEGRAVPDPVAARGCGIGREVMR